MTKEQRVIDYYVVCNKLKHILRRGWNDWNVESDRIESIAEHIFGVQMLAIAMKSEYEEYENINLSKVIVMIAIHELGKVFSGDNNRFYLSKEYREFVEHKTVHDVLHSIIDYPSLEKLYLEYEQAESQEAIFARQCDKLESDIQCKLYDEEGSVDSLSQCNKQVLRDQTIQQLVESEDDWVSIWINYNRMCNGYDDNFDSVSQYTLEHEIQRVRNRF